MSAGHQDVTLSRASWHRAGTFFEGLIPWLQTAGISSAWRKTKPPGGHLVDYWVYATLDDDKPAKSTVVFGVTQHAAVNPEVHAYARGKKAFLATAVQLLETYLATWEAQAVQEPDWRIVSMERRPCPCPAGGHWFRCSDDPQLSFVPSESSFRSVCGRWSEYEDADGRRWWCDEARKLVFFPA